MSILHWFYLRTIVFLSGRRTFCETLSVCCMAWSWNAKVDNRDARFCSHHQIEATSQWWTTDMSLLVRQYFQIISNEMFHCKFLRNSSPEVAVTDFQIECFCSWKKSGCLNKYKMLFTFFQKAWFHSKQVFWLQPYLISEKRFI